MGLRDIQLQSVYKSSEDGILMDFYVPCLQAACRYDRVAGFFSSTSFCAASRGILGLIEHGGHMRLICSPELQASDIEILRKSPRELERLVASRMQQAALTASDSYHGADHLAILAYMLARGLLEIRVAIPIHASNIAMSAVEVTSSGIFHEKTGAFEDARGDIVSFSGSINESATAWLENAEEFKVFRSWIPEQLAYQATDMSHFERLWHGTCIGVRTLSLPEAVKRDMLKCAPAELPIADLRAKYENRETDRVAERPALPLLFGNQLDAVDRWISAGRRGIFEMATGTGKTYTSLGCLKTMWNRGSGVVGVIAVPYQHLVQQWQKDVLQFGFPMSCVIEADSSHPQWRTKVQNRLLEIAMRHDSRAIVIATHATLSSLSLRQMVTALPGDTETLLIGDEVHGLGAPKMQIGLIDRFDARLGLSATPRRFMDEEGTDKLMSFFGEIVYSFPIEEAIYRVNPSTNLTYLTPYRYLPLLVHLAEPELHEYARLTESISRLRRGLNESSSQASEIIKLLLVKRSNIVKNAVQKMDALQDLLVSLGRNLSQTLVYCSPHQIDNVVSMIASVGVRVSRFTMEQGTRGLKSFEGRTERDVLLDEFAAGEIQVLVAMKCLDEGVDVPPARRAIMMASSSNPREYIQRIGRVLRRYPGKTLAEVYDLVVVPGTHGMSSGATEYERQASRNEFARYEYIAQHAVNNNDALSALAQARSAANGEE